MTEEESIEADILKALTDAYSKDPWVKGGRLRAKKTQLEKQIIGALLERLIADGVIAKHGSFPEDSYSLTAAGSGLRGKASTLLDPVHRVLQAKFHDEPDAYSFANWATK